MVSKAAKPSLPAAAAAASGLNHLLLPLHCAGVLRHPSGAANTQLCFRIFTAFMACSALTFICSEVVVLHRVGTADMDDFVLALTIVDSDGTWLFRVAHTAMHERNFHKLALQVGHDFAEFLSWDDLPLLREQGRLVRRFTLTYVGLGLAACIYFWASPEGPDGLPLVLALPYDVTCPFSFVATYAYIVITGMHVIVFTMVLDSFNVSLISQLRVQLMLLSSKIVRLAEEASEKPESPSKKSDYGELRYQLVKCIRHHQAIIKNADLLERNLGPMLLGQSIAIGASSCFQMFQCVSSGNGLQQTGKYGSYLFLVLAQLFIYCWFGDDLITEVSSPDPSNLLSFATMTDVLMPTQERELDQAAYDAVTRLQGCPLSIQRLLLLLMQRAQRPLRITAGGFFSLSRESFVSVVNVSYSFSAVLRSFKSEGE